MSFSFSAAGSRSEVLSSLGNLTDDALGDSLGVDIRDILEERIEGGADPGPSQRYVINASGHSSRHALVALNVKVTVEPVPTPPDATETPVTDTVTAGV